MWAGVALTKATNSSIAHTHTHRRKGNKLKRRQEWEREARQNELEIQKTKQPRLAVRIIIAKQAIILILSSSLARLFNAVYFLVTIERSVAFKSDCGYYTNRGCFVDSHKCALVYTMKHLILAHCKVVMLCKSHYKSFEVCYFYP